MSRADDLYLVSKKTIEIKAKEYAKQFPTIGFEEFLSQANFTFVCCVNNFKEGKSFTTYLSTSLEKALSGMAYDMIYDSPDFVELSNFIESKYLAVESPNIGAVGQLMDCLSVKAQEIIKTIFTAPLKSISNSRKQITRKSLYNYLHRRKGWSIWHYKQCCWEIQRALRENYV